MFFIKYALTNAIRLWKETIPLLLLTALIMLATTISSFLAAYSNQIFNQIKEKHEIAVSLFYSPVLSQTANIISEPPEITYGLIKQLSEDPSVTMASFNYPYTFDTPWLWQVNFHESSNTHGDIIIQDSGINKILFIGMTNTMYSDVPTILSGRGIVDSQDMDHNKRVVMISEYIAEQKNLNVGDKIQIYFPKMSSDSDESLMEDPFEIIGIYANYDTLEKNFYFYIPFSVIMKNSVIDNSQNIYGDIYFILNSPDSAADFIRRSIDKFSPLPLAMEANDYEYKREVYPSSTARELNNTIAIIATFTGVVLTIILNFILIRVRLRELVIQRKIGCPKTFVILTYTFEKCIISFIGIFIGGIVGSVYLNFTNSSPLWGSNSETLIHNALLLIGTVLFCSMFNVLSVVYRNKIEVE